MMTDYTEVILDSAVPYTEPLKDSRRKRIKSTGRPPSQWFLKENILFQTEEEMEDDTKATGDSEILEDNDKKILRPTSLRVIPSGEDVKNLSNSPPPWLEELRKKKQTKLQKNSSENIIKNNDNVKIHTELKLNQKFEIRQKKPSPNLENEDIITANRLSTNIILIVNNSSSKGTPPPTPHTSPSSKPNNDVFLSADSPSNEEMLRDFEDEEITEVMSPVNIDRKVSVGGIEEGMLEVCRKTSDSYRETKIFDDASSLTMVRPLTRSESLNRHTLKTCEQEKLNFGSASTENVFNCQGSTENDDIKNRLMDVVNNMEKIVQNNVLMCDAVRKELDTVITGNENVLKTLTTLKNYIERLNFT